MENTKIQATDSVKCGSCGADMRFDPKTQSLLCDHCGSVVTLNAKVTNEEKDYSKLDDTAFEQWTDGRAFRCENCGATTTFAEGEIATKCPFCGAPKIVSIDEQAGIKPMAVIPFAFTKEDARQYYLKWIKRRIFAPSGLKKSFNADTINGVYIPCWTFDSDTVSDYNGVLGEHYTVTVGSGKNRHTETRTRWFAVKGTFLRSFDDVTVEASSKMEQSDYDKIAPYPTNDACDYDSRFMAGFSAERYDKDVRESFKQAESVMRETVKREIVKKYNADVVQYLNVEMKHTHTTYKYVLLPVWVCSYKYKDKEYRFYTNGKSGKTGGKTPVSPVRAGFAVFLGIALLVLIIYLLMTYGE
ncbi:MAG: hypothetical protein ACI4S9_04175 [Christensenellales bacterium]